MRRRLGKAIDGRDPEGVHDMRVASRRLRAALSVFGPWLDKRRAQQAGRALRRLTRALGEVRELDVLRLRLAEMAKRASPERKLAIETVDSRIARQRVKARSRMIKTFAKVDLDQLDTKLREVGGAPPAWARDGAETSGLDAGIPWNAPESEQPNDEPIETLIAKLAPQITAAARYIVEKEVPGEFGSKEASDALHDIRIHAKKLRYQLETIAPYRGTEGDLLVDTLRGLQEHLGELHDDAVLDEVLVESVSREAARARPLLVAELRRLRTSRRAALRRDDRECRSTLESLRVNGFARAVADAVAAPATSGDEAPTETAATPRDAARSTSDAGATRPSPPPPSHSAPRGSVTNAREAGSGYAGEPIRKAGTAPVPDPTTRERPTVQEPDSAAARAAAAGSTSGSPPRKP